ncbi:ABC transporter substrate-binding protein [Pararhodobacter oceanensis]|uniref:Peptide ABC transporter substrate-binding protein n=1 Tax=Pararhodobacter oceanensis TaxID=2172121 RepID=A0A2T8HPG2_9RHOB|nr:ABC transporter substrate-binding protein [Pararhodobacter oceanensis]PVH27334.1 peptide ABC transporter substrate-binding protein [Pararhodobacter oceanensis]
MEKENTIASPSNPNRRQFLRKASAAGASLLLPAMGTATRAFADLPQRGGKFVMGLGGGESTDSLDPAFASSLVTIQIVQIFGEKLFEVNASGSLDMRLAEDLSSDSAAITWRFKIRQGISFHDGRPLQPQDVAETLRRHSDRASQSGALGILSNIQDIRTEGSDVIVELDTGNADFPYLLTDYHLVIQPGGGREAPADGIGTGPYRLVEAMPGISYAFEKIDDYWDDSRGHFDQVEILVINDSTARNSALQAGQVHVTNQVNPSIARFLGRSNGVSVKSTTSRAHYTFVMQCDTAPFDNYDLRMALKLAVNREELVEKILHGHGAVGNDTPINNAYPLFDGSLSQRTFDPELAREHYERSGHDGSPIVLHASDAAFPGALDAAQLYQQTAMAAGIDIRIQREPSDGYFSEVWNRKPFCISRWGGRPVQDQMYSTAYLSDAEWNDTRFQNEEFDALLYDARAETNTERRTALYASMADILRDEGGLICPMFNNFVVGVRDNISGWEENGNSELMDGLAPHKCWFS